MGIASKRTSYGRADRRALVTEHAVGDGLGCTLKKADWQSATAVEDNIVPCLYPVVVDANGIATPYAAGELSGFTINPTDVSGGDEPAGYIWHGTIDPELLPVDFDPSTVTGAAVSRFLFTKA